MPQFSETVTAVGAAFGTNTDPTSATTGILLPLGVGVLDRTGRRWRWCKAGASDLVAGNWIQSSAIIANHLANTPPAVAIGATSFSYTPGATAGAANLYAEGYLQVDTTPGNGNGPYLISGHAAISSSTAFTLNLAEPILVALTTSSRVGLIANPYQNVIQGPATTATGSCVGVASYIITAAYNGWIQTWGIGSPLMTDTCTVGLPIGVPSGTAGGVVQVSYATNVLTATPIGQMAQTAVSGKNNAAFLRIS